MVVFFFPELAGLLADCNLKPPSETSKAPDTTALSILEPEKVSRCRTLWKSVSTITDRPLLFRSLSALAWTLRLTSRFESQCRHEGGELAASNGLLV